MAWDKHASYSHLIPPPTHLISEHHISMPLGIPSNWLGRKPHPPSRAVATLEARKSRPYSHPLRMQERWEIFGMEHGTRSRGSSETRIGRLPTRAFDSSIIQPSADSKVWTTGMMKMTLQPETPWY